MLSASHQQKQLNSEIFPSTVIKTLLIICILLVCPRINAQVSSYTLRINSLTNIDKLIPIDINSSEYNKKNFSVGGLIRGKAFKLNGMRLGFDYSRYNLTNDSKQVNYSLETYRITPGKDFEVYDSWCRLLVGFEFILGFNSGIKYSISDESLSLLKEYNEGFPLEHHSETGTISTESILGTGLFVESEKQIISDLHIGINFSLNVISVKDNYNLQGNYSYNNNGSIETSGSFMHYSSNKRSLHLDPLARIYIRF